MTGADDGCRRMTAGRPGSQFRSYGRALRSSLQYQQLDVRSPARGTAPRPRPIPRRQDNVLGPVRRQCQQRAGAEGRIEPERLSSGSGRDRHARWEEGLAGESHRLPAAGDLFLPESSNPGLHNAGAVCRMAAGSSPGGEQACTPPLQHQLPQACSFRDAYSTFVDAGSAVFGVSSGQRRLSPGRAQRLPRPAAQRALPGGRACTHTAPGGPPPAPGTGGRAAAPRFLPPNPSPPRRAYSPARAVAAPRPGRALTGRPAHPPPSPAARRQPGGQQQLRRQPQAALPPAQ
jgi:hypothetical protein